MIIDHKPSKDELESSFRKNVCNRNKELRALIRAVINCPSNAILALDGDWGSGKTFLIRQLELLWNDDSFKFSDNSLQDEEYRSFRNNLIPFYYNAWENDYYNDPSQSLLLSLTQSLNEKQNIIQKSERNLVNKIKFKDFIENISHELISTDSDELDIIQSAKQIKTIRGRINRIIGSEAGFGADRKLLFIIDDLDRCNPQFAVKLLEYVKTGFEDQRVIFLIATNYLELGNIVRGYYGGQINGHQYLDRFFDLKISVGSYDIESYVRHKSQGAFNNYPALDVACHLNLSMREANRYMTLISMYDSYLKNDYFVRDKKFHDVCRFVFIPIFSGYRIKRYETYIELSTGNGFSALSEYVKTDTEMMAYTKRVLSDEPQTNDDVLLRNLEKYYERLFKRDADNKVVADGFWDILNITSSSIDY